MSEYGGYHSDSDSDQEYGSDVEGGFIGALKKRWKKGKEEGFWKGLGINWAVCGIFELFKAFCHWSGTAILIGLLIALVVSNLVVTILNHKMIDHIQCQQDENTNLIKQGFGLI